MQLKMTIEIWQKGEWYIATCPELDFVSQGPSPEDARRNLLEVIEIQFEEMSILDTLENYLLECGYAQDEGLLLIPQSEMVSFERTAMQVA